MPLSKKFPTELLHKCQWNYCWNWKKKKYNISHGNFVKICMSFSWASPDMSVQVFGSINTAKLPQHYTSFSWICAHARILTTPTERVPRVIEWAPESVSRGEQKAFKLIPGGGRGYRRFPKFAVGFLGFLWDLQKHSKSISRGLRGFHVNFKGVSGVFKMHHKISCSIVVSVKFLISFRELSGKFTGFEKFSGVPGAVMGGFQRRFKVFLWTSEVLDGVYDDLKHVREI